MVEQLLTLRINELHNIDDGSGNGRLKKNVSFNTDDDDSAQLNDSQHISDNESVGTKSSSGVSRSEERTRSLLSIHSPSIDSINDLDGLAPDTPLAEKIKKKRHRRSTEQKQEETKKVVPKSPPWYTRVELLKPIGYVALIVLLYLAWTKRDVWIPRMLTSNSRIRHIAIANEEKLHEKGFTPAAPSSDNANSTKSDSEADDDDDDDDGKGSAKKTSGQVSSTNTDDNAQLPLSKRPPPQKINLRTRRNKMSFSKERGDKKRQRVRYSTVDGDDDDDDDDVDIDGAIESDQSDGDKVNDVEPTVSTRHRRSRDQSHKSSRTKTALVSLPVDPVVEQLRLLVVSRRKHPELLAVLAKQTGLKKDKVKQLIEKGNFRTVSLDKLVSIVNSYDSSLLTAVQ